MRRVAVVGVGQLPFRSRYADKSYLALSFEATKKALDDAKLDAKDIEAVTYAFYCPLMERQEAPDIYAHDYLGLQGIPTLRVSAGAATEGVGMYAAFTQVASGNADIVLCLGVQKGSDYYSFETKSRADGFHKAMSLAAETTWEQPLLAGGPPALLSVLCVVPHMHRYGGPTEEQLAKVSLKNHKNALVNPIAQLKEDLTLEDILYSRIVAWPTTMYQCCLMSDGGAALILASEEKARQITDKPIWMSGAASSYYSIHSPEPHLLGRIPAVAEAAKRAYDMAGIKDPLEELDVAEVHDIITGVEIMAYEELGLCPLGEGGRLVDEGVVEKSGSLPVNPSGGRVACGHVASASGMSSACDVVLQLREEAGNIQVPIRRGKGLVETICGAASFATVTVFERGEQKA